LLVRFQGLYRRMQEFERNPHGRGAIRLRRWDDMAKVPGLAVPGLEHYRSRVEAALEASRSA
jgi:[1-hydroxy-2-(trimethylamino)ethyl]phosphonate dioxygenase